MTDRTSLEPPRKPSLLLSRLVRSRRRHATKDHLTVVSETSTEASGPNYKVSVVDVTESQPRIAETYFQTTTGTVPASLLTHSQMVSAPDDPGELKAFAMDCSASLEYEKTTEEGSLPPVTESNQCRPWFMRVINSFIGCTSTATCTNFVDEFQTSHFDWSQCTSPVKSDSTKMPRQPTSFFESDGYMAP